VAGVLTIRQALPEEASAVIDVWARSWQAAYPGLLAADVIDRATSPAEVARRAGDLARLLADERWRDGLLVADVAGSGIVGYARFGPERGTDGLPLPLPAAPPTGATAELYAIYVAPEAWSTGAGRAMITTAVQRATELRYRTLSLWVLESNERARRFYEKAGFAGTGESKTEGRFGDVTEVRYLRQLG
jgi:GNAT superfamily N-acetyltransferase